MSIEAKRAHLFVRQPLSTLGKIAFWTFLVGAISGIGGTIALTITNGSPSRDIVITMVCALVGTILVATGIRWMQVIATLLGAYVLYLVFTEPFVIESLANPKGPNGGFGHFVGDVLVIANTILSFVACTGMVLQDYRRGSRKAPRWLPSVVAGVLGLVIGASFIGVLAQPVSSATSTTLTYTNGVPTIHMSPGGFGISSATIAKGSKLLLVDDTTEQHVLANGTWQQNTPVQKREPGAPLVSNLSLSGNSVTIGPFATAGTYHILCLLHRGMNLTINVQ
jgi:hypothetical protein